MYTKYFPFEKHFLEIFTEFNNVNNYKIIAYVSIQHQQFAIINTLPPFRGILIFIPITDIL